VQREVGMAQIKRDKRYVLALELVRAVLEKKVLKLIAGGSVTINSSEIYRHCLEKYGDEDRCAAATSHAAHFLNKHTKRLVSNKARWLVTWEFLKTLCDVPYSDLRDTPLGDLDAYCFYYAIAALLYAKPVEGDVNGDGN